MKNIELKVSVNDFSETTSILNKIGARYCNNIYQIDKYYWCNSGRLKTRNSNENKLELIFYQRPDKKISKISNYQILNIKSGQLNDLESILESAFGKKIIVKKERELWLFKNTRIHLDKVDDLGNFIEIETVVKNIRFETAKKEYIEIIKLLNLLKYKKHTKSYSDLLEEVEQKSKFNSSQLGLESSGSPKDVLRFLNLQIKV